MSTVLRPPAAASAPTVERLDRPAPSRRRPEADRAVAASLRFAAFAALVLYGCEHWVRQVAPTASRSALQMAAVAVAAAALFSLTGRVPAARRRRLAVAAIALPVVLLGLAAAGIPVRYVGWRHWDELTSGVGEGLSALPNLSVPYRGLDQWVRWIVASGAALLGILAAALAYAGRRGPVVSGRRQAGTALTLAVLYAVPVVERNPESPWLSGAGFAVLLALLLGADRLTGIVGARPRLVAAGAAVLALGLAALAAPQLDGARPWVDYRHLADDLAKRNQVAFDWNHSYAPLDWPRDGREVLRIRAKEPSYWKATVLRRFDGKRWTRETRFVDPDEVDTPIARDHPDWSEDLQVTVRSLRSEQFVAAGFATSVTKAPRPPRAAGSGTWRTTGRPLRPGDTYAASVYTPRPTLRELTAAGTDYPDYTLLDRTMELPPSVGGPVTQTPRSGRDPQTTTFVFPAFGTESAPTVVQPGRQAYLGGADLLERSGYARTWALSQRLRAQSRSQLDLVRRVRRRVQQGAVYTERPAQGRVPLDAFLFDTHEGYCQQFSGAMVLLLRMAGVPARVAAGFGPGTLDSDRGQYVVRDLDAHSWVEAFFPGIGWVTFDPTPTVAPPAAQDAGDGGDRADDGENAAQRSGADGADASKGGPGASSATAAEGDGGGHGPAWGIAGGVVLLALAGGAAWWWRRPRVVLEPVDELRRALSRTGRAPAAGLTLSGLEHALRGTPGAQAYVRKLRLARYAGREEAPTRADRAALRDELAAGLGPVGRLRAWWALPPRTPARR